jgi:hypothetical protein
MCEFLPLRFSGSNAKLRRKKSKEKRKKRKEKRQKRKEKRKSAVAVAVVVVRTAANHAATYSSAMDTEPSS